MSFGSNGIKLGITLLKFCLDYFKFGDANVKKDGINETFVPVRIIYWKYMVEHAKTVRKIDNIGFGKRG
jgi:hypothetical protein